ncbi:MAG TPA: hypothetical protein VG452_00575 [Egibacteraceae bacterium]|nr:hypothetical protein [Actinomycetota bacterium]HWB70684.1 hypothetical protein [Egibacteraceae bacterium]
MARERKNAPRDSQRAGRRPRPVTPGESIRRRLSEHPELELNEEELRALADEGIDPDDVRRLARERSEGQEASDHDRDTARDHLEGLVLEQEEDY